MKTAQNSRHGIQSAHSPSPDINCTEHVSTAADVRTQSISVSDPTAYPVNSYVLVSDGTHTIIGQVTAKVHLVQTVEDVALLDVKDPEKLAYITQTTLSVDDTRSIISALMERFPSIVGPDVRDICYATQNRQQAVRDLAHQVDMILVVGSRNSSNSNRLREIGQELGKPSYLIDDAEALQADWFNGIHSVGVTAGASAPETLVQGVLQGLRRFGEVDISTQDGVAEDVRFRFPAQLADA